MSCNSFSIITLNAEKILNSIKESNIEKGSDGNFKVVFSFDLCDKNPKRRDVVLREDDCPTNALFWQICKILNESPKKDSLLRYFVFIDFSKIFSRNISTENKTTPSKEDFLGNNGKLFIFFGIKAVGVSGIYTVGIFAFDEN